MTSLTPEEIHADLTLDKLKQLVGLAEYENLDPFPVTVMDVRGTSLARSRATSRAKRGRSGSGSGRG